MANASQSLPEFKGRNQNVDMFQASGDAKETFDGSITSGTPDLETTSDNFAAADVGKYISVGGAGAAGATLITTIEAYVSPTEVTLADNAGTTVTDATVFWATDNLPAFQAMHDSAPNGRRFGVPPGRYFLSATWEITKTLQIHGAGDADAFMEVPIAGTVLEFAEGVTGIKLPNNLAGRTTLSDFTLASRSIAAGSDVGIWNQSNSVRVSMVSIRNFGSHGISTNTRNEVTPEDVNNPNANDSRYQFVRAFFNRGDGFYASGHDSNDIKYDHCSAAWNDGWGFREEYDDSTGGPFDGTSWIGFNNRYDGCHTQTNGLGCYYVDNSDAIFINPYAEPDGPNDIVVNISGTAVTRVSGTEFSSRWIGMPLQIGGSGYGPIVASVADADNLVIESNGFEALPSDGSGLTAMIRINQRAELGSHAQFTIWQCGTPLLNAPYISPLNVGYNGRQLVGGSDNSTHMVQQLGRFLNRLSVRGRIPKQLMEDTTPNTFTGTCNTSGATITRLTGPDWDSTILNSVITIDGTQYLIDILGAFDADTCTVKSFDSGPDDPGTLSGVDYTISLSRTYQWRVGLAGAGDITLQDLNTAQIPFAYYPPYGFQLKGRVSVIDSPAIVVLADTTETTGKTYSIRAGATAGALTISDETDAVTFLQYLDELLTIASAMKVTNEAAATSATPSEVVIGGGGTSPQAGTIAWGDSTGWCLDLGTRVSSTFARRFRLTDRGSMEQRGPAPSLVLEDTNSGGTKYTINNGSYGLGALTIYDDTAAAYVLIWDKISNKIFVQKPTTFNSNVIINSPSGSVIPLRVNATTGQSAAILMLVNESGDIAFQIAADGVMTVRDLAGDPGFLFPDGSGNIATKKVSMTASTDVDVSGLTNNALIKRSGTALASVSGLSADRVLKTDGSGGVVTGKVSPTDADDFDASGLSGSSFVVPAGGVLGTMDYSTAAAAVAPYIFISGVDLATHFSDIYAALGNHAPRITDLETAVGTLTTALTTKAEQGTYTDSGGDTVTI